MRQLLINLSATHSVKHEILENLKISKKSTSCFTECVALKLINNCRIVYINICKSFSHRLFKFPLFEHHGKNIVSDNK
jgi:hypothetical protein